MKKTTRAAAPLVYLYGILGATSAPSVRVAGLPAMTPPRVVDVGRGLWLVVSDADGVAYGEAAIAEGLHDLEWVGARAAAHEKVVERFGREATIVPMKLFTIFTGEARAIAHVEKLRAQVTRILTRIGGCHEWGMRVRFDGRAASAPSPRAGGKSSKKSGPRASGTGYLMMKKKIEDVERDGLASALDAADALYDAMARRAKAAHNRPPAVDPAAAANPRAKPARLVLDAFFLVEDEKADAFRAALEKDASRAQRPGLSIELTGPWPPYNFVTR